MKEFKLKLEDLDGNIITFVPNNLGVINITGGTWIVRGVIDVPEEITINFKDVRLIEDYDR